MAKVDKFSARLRKYMDMNNERQVDILEKCKREAAGTGVKFNKSDISQYLKDYSEPKQDKLYIMSKALSVDPAWLMGYEVPMKPNDKLETASDVAAELFLATKNGDRINKLINKYNDLTEEEKDQVDAFIDFVKLQRKV